MILEQIPDLKKLLDKPKSIVIVCHKNPDGDAVGSSLGLYHYLQKNKHNVTVIVPNDYPHFLKWMPGNDSILKYDSQTQESQTLIKNAEVIFTLDFNALHRSGDMEKSLEESPAVKIMIDHHQQPDGYATFIYSDVTMSSTCEMVYHFIDMLGDTKLIDANIADCLYSGIVTDTGSFRFPSTTSKTHKVVSDLIDKGAHNSNIQNQIFPN